MPCRRLYFQSNHYILALILFYKAKIDLTQVILSYSAASEGLRNKDGCFPVVRIFYLLPTVNIYSLTCLEFFYKQLILRPENENHLHVRVQK